MKKILLLIAAPFVLFSTLSAQITQEQADSIVLERLNKEIQSYTLHAKEDVQKEMIITSAAGEMLELDYPCWVYYIRNDNNTGCYLIVNENNGNLLEIKVTSYAEPNDLAEWRKIIDKVSFTPCQQDKQQNKMKSSESSSNVKVEFTAEGVHIIYRDFEVTCDFTDVNVTHTLVNGVLRITQKGTPNQANCICYTDISYTINGILQNEVNVIFINGVQVYCYNDKPQELCHCIMDTLKGDWSWIKTYGGIGGQTFNNEFKSIVKILSQNEDASINYEVFVADTSFYKGSFQLQHPQWAWGLGVGNIKLPHQTTPNHEWIIDFDYLLEFIDGAFRQTKVLDILIFKVPAADGFNYYYEKFKKL